MDDGAPRSDMELIRQTPAVSRRFTQQTTLFTGQIAMTHQTREGVCSCALSLTINMPSSHSVKPMGKQALPCYSGTTSDFGFICDDALL